MGIKLLVLVYQMYFKQYVNIHISILLNILYIVNQIIVLYIYQYKAVCYLVYIA